MGFENLGLAFLLFKIIFDFSLKYAEFGFGVLYYITPGPSYTKNLNTKARKNMITIKNYDSSRELSNYKIGDVYTFYIHNPTLNDITNYLPLVGVSTACGKDICYF